MARSFNSGKLRQAINNYNASVRRYNQQRRTAVNQYNQKVRQYNQQRRAVVNQINQYINRYNAAVRQHNARVRSNQARYNQAVQRFNSTQAKLSNEYRSSTRAVSAAYETLDVRQSSFYEQSGRADLLDLAEREAVNSLEVANALEEHEVERQDEAAREISSLLQNELAQISVDLDARWQGAIFSLKPENPEATRHFCTSVREIITELLNLGAPIEQLREWKPGYECVRDTAEPTRRERINFILETRDITTPEFQDFVDTDIRDTLQLFRELNSGTHGSAGKYSMTKLVSIKVRVEDLIRFLTRILSY